MPTWNSRGLRGSVLEDMINRTIDIYRENKMALIQKIPTPITPITIEKQSRHITLAYFDKKSTVDYIGTVQGIPICFDAKECTKDSFPLDNIHEHQLQFMEEFEEQQGIAFIILYYTHLDEIYYLPLKTVKGFFERMAAGGRKSFRYEEIPKEYRIRSHNGVAVHFLEQLQRDINSR